MDLPLGMQPAADTSNILPGWRAKIRRADRMSTFRDLRSARCCVLRISTCRSVRERVCLRPKLRSIKLPRNSVASWGSSDLPLAWRQEIRLGGGVSACRDRLLSNPNHSKHGSVSDVRLMCRANG